MLWIRSSNDSIISGKMLVRQATITYRERRGTLVAIRGRSLTSNARVRASGGHRHACVGCTLQGGP